jgi:hypothetical protein
VACVAAFPHGVLRIVFGSTLKKVRGVDARADITAVEYQRVVIRAPVFEKVAHGVRFETLVVDADDAVAVRAGEARPEPARFGAARTVNVLPEPVDLRVMEVRNALRHESPPRVRRG